MIFIRVNWARNLKATGTSSHVKNSDVNVKATARQAVSYNLDVIKQNGSTALMYSRRKCC